MTTYFDSADTQAPATREAAQFVRLAERFGALQGLSAWAARLGGAATPVDRASLAPNPTPGAARGRCTRPGFGLAKSSKTRLAIR
jgi:hypothetical protein